jgi:hypothetical protein
MWVNFSLFAQPLSGWDIPSAYARSAVFAGRRAIEGKAVAARAADIASLCYLPWQADQLKLA